MPPPPAPPNEIQTSVDSKCAEEGLQRHYTNSTFPAHSSLVLPKMDPFLPRREMEASRMVSNPQDKHTLLRYLAP